jgi:two-component system response regulator HydG
MGQILVLDDHATVRDGVATVLHRDGHQVRSAGDAAEALAAWKREGWEIDLVLTDIRMDPMDGMAVLQEVQQRFPATLVMMMTAHGSVSLAVEAMRQGAWDFLEKPFSSELLRSRVDRALDVRGEREAARRLAEENRYLRTEARPSGGSAALDAILGNSAPMQRLRQLIARVAPRDSVVHIHGESGTGKELVAQAIHELSERASGPMIRVNCGALAESLLESELFGHEKGAFTDAVRQHVGRFELARGGTLLLDEVGDMPMSMQVKLLRVLQEGTYERVGGGRTLRTDARIVTATHRSLEEEVRAGRFREDLFYRLHIVPLHVPALRERMEDLPLLVSHFVERLRARTRSEVRGVSAECLRVMQRYDWPGNVRQLENALEQAMVFAEGALVEVEDLPAALVDGPRSVPVASLQPGQSLPEMLEALERRLIEDALQVAQGVKTEAARVLGIKTPSLYYKLEKYGLIDAGTSDS